MAGEEQEYTGHRKGAGTHGIGGQADQGALLTLASAGC